MDEYDRAAELAGALRARLADLRFPLGESVESKIRQQVRALTDELKSLGHPAEAVLVAVKYLANQAGIDASTAVLASNVALDGREKLLVDVLKWCVEQYYRPPPPA